MIRWSEVTAIFGGTFDPPHLGHREAVSGLFREPGVREVRVIPSAAPPHKKSFTPAEHRVAMARLTFGGLPDVTVDLREIERAEATRAPSYSFDTLQELRRERPKLAFVVGTDQLRDLPKWRRFPDLLDLCHWIALERSPGGEAEAREALALWQANGWLREPTGDREWKLPGGTRLRIATTEAPALSSTAIREELARSGRPPESALAPRVADYLKQHRLYGSEVGPDGE